MRADDAVRYNAAVGALVGLAVGDALAARRSLPVPVSGGPVDDLTWSAVAGAAFGNAEALLRGAPIEMDVTAIGIVAGAIALGDPDASPPLLADPDAVRMCAIVRDAMNGRAGWPGTSNGSATITAAVETVTAAKGFVDALRQGNADDLEPESLALIGALAGLRFGPGSIPAAWTTGVHGAVGDRMYRLRQLRRLGERLMRFEAPAPPEPRRSLGPREVAPRLWLSNLHAVPRFLTAHPDGAVISLCPTTGAFDDHPFRREFILHDAGGREVNPSLSTIVDDVLSSIAAFHDEGRNVLVHCHHGASRTGLILRAWLIDHHGMGTDDATTEAAVRWPKTSTWNRAFCLEIERRAASAEHRRAPR